jgi:hypothetical protein
MENAREDFRVFHNEDYCCQVLWVSNVQDALNRTSGYRMLGEERSNEDQESSEEPLLEKPVLLKAGKYRARVGYTMEESVSKRRMVKDDTNLTLFVEITSELSNDAETQPETFSVWITIISEGGEKPLNKHVLLRADEGYKRVEVDRTSIMTKDAVFGVEFLFNLSGCEEATSSKYPGLVNMGMTCYMNSYLQTLFHLRLFVNQLLRVSRPY